MLDGERVGKRLSLRVIRKGRLDHVEVVPIERPKRSR